MTVTTNWVNRTQKALITTLLYLLAGLSNATEIDNPQVELDTSMGSIVIELFAKDSPITVANFLEYTDEGFYDGTIFHRVKAWFVIQGGGVTEQFERKKTRPPIVNESANGLRNDRGTVAMARYSDPDSASSQFYINVEDNNELDAKPTRAGYTVFGKVISGMDVVDAISEVDTGTTEGFANLPVETITVNSVKRIDGHGKAAQPSILDSLQPVSKP